jgi:hypothetical protein
MSTPEEKATALKNEGNKAFAAHDWPTAIEFYTKAIELNDKEKTFYSNRAQVRLAANIWYPSILFARVTDMAAPCIGIPEDRSVRLCHRRLHKGH